MNYTKKEIEEMRKRIPFRASVGGSEVMVQHIFDCGACADTERSYPLFKEITDPEYVQFTFDDAKLFRDEWIEIFSGSISKIVNVHINGVTVADGGDELTFMTYDHLFENAKFADSGKPFGKEVK